MRYETVIITILKEKLTNIIKQRDQLHEKMNRNYLQEAFDLEKEAIKFSLKKENMGSQKAMEKLDHAIREKKRLLTLDQWQMDNLKENMKKLASLDQDIHALKNEIFLHSQRRRTAV